jgi:ParB-like chromosome segregation protein Spo0J
MTKKKRGPRSLERSRAKPEVEHTEDTPAASDSLAGPLFHPACALFPQIEGEEFDALVADIKAHGQQQPIVRYRGLILEGKNRFFACEAAGVPPVYADRDDIVDTVAFVISANIRRRHLTTKQKRDLIARLLKLDCTKSDRWIAGEIGTSHHTVGAVRVEQEAVGQIAQQVKIKTKDGKVRPRQVKAPKPPKPPKSPPKRSEGVMPGSAGELARLQARIDELENENRQLEIKITGLESQVAELKAELAATSQVTVH